MEHEILDLIDRYWKFDDQKPISGWQDKQDLLEAVRKALRIHDVVGRSEQLVNFLLHLNDKKLINNHDFDYEKEAKKYLKKLTNCH